MSGWRRGPEAGRYWLQGCATRARNSSALMEASRMSSRKGRSAWNTSRLKLMERPTATAAVAAPASLPSSFTCRHSSRQPLGRKLTR